MTDREALQIAFNALVEIDRQTPYPIAKHAIKCINAAFNTNAQPEQEPVAYFWRDTKLCYWIGHGSPKIDFQDLANLDVKPLYTAPPSKPQDVDVGIDVTEFGTHLVVRRGNEVIKSEFYHAPKREWVSLTDEAVIKIVRQLGWGQSDFDVSEILEVVRAIEAALKERNT